jgi:hypothetical protein
MIWLYHKIRRVISKDARLWVNLLIIGGYYGLGIWLGTQYDWTIWQCIYYTTVTVTTVGYGDFSPESQGGKVAGIFFILIGLMVILSMIQEMADDWLTAMQKKIIEAADDDGDSETNPHEGKIKIATAVFVLNVVILSGAAFFYAAEDDWTFIDAVWWAVCTVTTVGYGDLSLTNENSRIFSIGYIIVGISTFAWALGQIASVRAMGAAAKRRAELCNQKLKPETIKKMDAGGDGEVSDGEFLMFCLVEEPGSMVSRKDCQHYLKQFAKLDKDDSGVLSREDLLVLAEDTPESTAATISEEEAKEQKLLYEMLMHDQLVAEEKRAKQLNCLRALKIDVEEESVGSIQFKEGAGTSQYIRVSADQHPLDLYRFMTTPVSEGGWGLSEPELLVSVTGTAQKVQPNELTKAFTSTLKNVMQWKYKDSQKEGGSSTWLVTGGTEMGVMKLAGEASRGGNAHKSAVLIGVCPWGKVSANETLKGTTQRVASGEPVLYEKTNANSDKSAFLQCHHSHFIFVDDKQGPDEWGTEIGFRYQLEHVIKNRSRAIVEESILQDQVRCLNLTLCFGGGVGAMRCMLHSLLHDIPIVVVADSGGAADALIAALDSSDCKPGAHTTTGTNGKSSEEANYTDKLALKLGGKIDSDGKGSIPDWSKPDWSTAVADGKEVNACSLIAEKRSLIIVNRMESADLLEDSIARGLMQKILQVAAVPHESSSEVPLSENEMERREFEALRVMLNRAVRTYHNVHAADFTMQLMCNDGLTTDELEKVLKPNLLQILTQNQHEFFYLFLEHFDDSQVWIRDLYNICWGAQFKKQYFYLNTKLQAIRNINDNYCDHQDVHRMLSNMLGRDFLPLSKVSVCTICTHECVHRMFT